MANGSNPKPVRNRKLFEGRGNEFGAGFAAAALLIVSLMASGLVFVGQFVVSHWPTSWTPTPAWAGEKLAEVVGSKEGRKSPPSGLDGKTMYITMFYKGDRQPLQIWKATFHGSDTLTVDIVDTENGNKIVGTAYPRSNGITISYASADPRRPGYGNFTLQQVQSAMASEMPVFTGTGVVHDCECKDKTVNPNGKLLNIPVLMTDRGTPTVEQQDLFLSKEPREPVGVTPDELRGLRRQSSLITDVIKLSALPAAAVTPVPHGRACSCVIPPPELIAA